MIHCAHVSFRYEHNAPVVVRDISFRVEKGEYITIIGPNGSGKSTLAHLISGLLAPTTGTMTLNRLDTTDPQFSTQRAQRVGIVFQHPDNQLIAATVAEDVSIGLQLVGRAEKEIDERCQYILQRVGLWERRNDPVHHLSGGEKQRVCLAGILAMEPDVIVCDEAMTMLDPASRQQVQQLIREWHADGLTVINVTHDLEQLSDADRVFIMHDGALVADQKPEALFALEAHHWHAFGLVPPAQVAMLHQLREAGVSIPVQCVTVCDWLQEHRNDRQ